MTLWVDDLSFSSSTPLPNDWTRSINKFLKEVSLQLKMSKTKVYSKKDHKVITGTAISPDGKLLVRNTKRKEILDILQNRSVEDLSLKEARSLQGKLASQRQNEPAFFGPMYARCKAHVKKLVTETKNATFSKH